MTLLVIVHSEGWPLYKDGTLHTLIAHVLNIFEYQKTILYISSFLKILESTDSKKDSSRSVFNDHIIVKFVLKLFQTYKTPDYFLYLCNGLTSIASPEAND